MNAPSDFDLEGLPAWARKAVSMSPKPEASPRSAADHRGLPEWPLFVEAATVASFLPRELAPGVPGGVRVDAEKAVLRFAELSHEAEGTRWSLTREARRSVLDVLERDEVAAAIRSTATRFPDALSGALRHCLGDSDRSAVEGVDLKTLEATRVAVTWLRGVRQTAHLPAIEELDREIELRRLLARFKRMIGEPEAAGTSRPNRFFGRDKEIESLRAFIGAVDAETFLGGVARAASHLVRAVTLRERKPLNVWGIGGVGKTTLVAKFMLEHAEAAASRFPFAYLDFDRSTISARNRPGLLMEMCQQVGAQFGELTKPMAQLVASIAEATRHVEVGTSKEMSVLSPFARQFRQQVDGLMSQLESRFEFARPFLLVFDTFEVVQYGPDQVTALEALIRAFADRRKTWPRLRLIISGRGKVPAFLGETEPIPLGALDRKGSAEMLVALAADAKKPIGMSEASALVAAIVKRVDKKSPLGVQPLRLRLIGEVFGDANNTDDGAAIVQSLLDELNAPSSETGLSGTLLVDGILVRRILGHVGDRRVRALADPGLVVRRINAEVIREVMTRGTSKPPEKEPDPKATVQDTDTIDPWIVTSEEAKSIFDAFKKEVSLVEPDGKDLRHRQDVRQEMLPLIRARRPKRFFALHRLAFDFFRKSASAAPSDHAAAAEAIYHGLWLQEPLEVLDGLWPRQGTFDARIDPEEFDEGSLANIYVRAKRRAPLEPEEILKLPRAIAIDWLGDQRDDLLRVQRLGATIDAIRAAAGNDFSALDERPDIAAVMARLLYRAGLWQETALLLRRHLHGGALAEVAGAAGRSEPSLRLESLISLVRTWATIAGRCGAPMEELEAIRPAAFAVGDPLVRVELMAHLEIGLRQQAGTEPLRKKLRSGIARSFPDVQRNRWVKDSSRILRLAILSCPDETDDLMKIYLETTDQMSREHELRPFLQVLLVDAGFDLETPIPRTEGPMLNFLWKERRMALLDMSWEERRALTPALCGVVAFDHSDWTRAFGNALSRDMSRDLTPFRRIAGLLQWRGSEAESAVERKDGELLVQAATDDGRLLDFTRHVSRLGQFIHEPDFPATGLVSDEARSHMWTYPDTAPEIARALLRWHGSTLPESRPGLDPALA